MSRPFGHYSLLQMKILLDVVKFFPRNRTSSINTILPGWNFLTFSSCPSWLTIDHDQHKCSTSAHFCFGFRLIWITKGGSKSKTQNDLLTFAIWANCYTELPSTQNFDHCNLIFLSCSSEKFASTLRKNRHSTFKHVASCKTYFINLCSCFKNVSLHLFESIINSSWYQTL